MKIFFVASIHGKKEFGESYEKIVDLLGKEGHEVISSHVLSITSAEAESWDEQKNINFHKKVLEGLKKADVIVTELSYSSMSVGYLISIAIENGTPTIAFYRGKEKPHLLKTLEENEKFQLVNYQSSAELENQMRKLIKYATEQMDSRFNFFVSPKIVNYLDWIAKEKRLPRSVYLRNLIENDIRKKKEDQ